MKVENLNPLQRMGIMNKFLMMSAMVLSVAAAPVLAQSGEEDGRKNRIERKLEKMFEKNDADKDGSISKKEFTASAEKRFSDMDKDGDGSLSKDEAKEHAEKMHEKWEEHKKKRMEGEAVEGRHKPTPEELKAVGTKAELPPPVDSDLPPPVDSDLPPPVDSDLPPPPAGE